MVESNQGGTDVPVEEMAEVIPIDSAARAETTEGLRRPPTLANFLIARIGQEYRSRQTEGAEPPTPDDAA